MEPCNTLIMMSMGLQTIFGNNVSNGSSVVSPWHFISGRMQNDLLIDGLQCSCMSWILLMR